MVKKFFFIILIFISFSLYSLDFDIVTVDLPYGETTLKATFYCFNDLETGQALADKLFKPINLKNELRKGGFKKLMILPVGAKISGYNYSIMIYEREFWFFETRDDGWLWGTGRW